MTQFIVNCHWSLGNVRAHRITRPMLLGPLTAQREWNGLDIGQHPTPTAPHIIQQPRLEAQDGMLDPRGLV